MAEGTGKSNAIDAIQSKVWHAQTPRLAKLPIPEGTFPTTTPIRLSISGRKRP